MGLIDMLFRLVFGDGRNVIKETAEVFRANAEQADARSTDVQLAALAQLSAEFAAPRRGLFDRLIDGLNRIPRPAMALGTLALFLLAMADPVWFSERMQGMALVPEPLWWLLGAIVSFYFGARHQAKGHEFQRALAATLLRAPQVVENIAELRRLSDGPATSGAIGSGEAEKAADKAEAEAAAAAAARPEENPALADWAQQRRRGLREIEEPPATM